MSPVPQHKPGQAPCAACSNLYRSIFGGGTEDTMEKVTEMRHCRTYPRRYILFWEGDEPRELYCIHRGKVKLYKTSPEGEMQIVRIAGEGDLLGYRSFLSQEPYRATAETLEDVEVCVIPAAEFQRLLLQDPGLSRRMMEHLARDLGKAEEHLYELSQQPVKVRLADELLRLLEHFGTPEGELDIPLLRDDLASMVGATPETVSRVLTRFKKAGWIAVENRRIRILNPEALRNLTANG